MPYIPQEHRNLIDDSIDVLIEDSLHVPKEKRGGALNYIICRLTLGILDPRGYTELSNALGHISSAETEIRRRLLDPYEDKCIVDNGDLDDIKNLCEIALEDLERSQMGLKR
jgi:hypothetical protein